MLLVILIVAVQLLSTSAAAFNWSLTERLLEKLELPEWIAVLSPVSAIFALLVGELFAHLDTALSCDYESHAVIASYLLAQLVGYLCKEFALELHKSFLELFTKNRDGLE